MRRDYSARANDYQIYLEIFEGISAGSLTSSSFETASMSFVSEKFLLNFIFSIVSVSVLKKSSSLMFSSMSRNVETTFEMLVLQNTRTIPS